MSVVALLLPAAALALAAPVYGQTESQATVEDTVPSQDALEASYRLLESTRYEEQVKASLYPVGLAVFDEFLNIEAERSGITFDTDLKEKLRSAFVEQLDLVVDEFTQDSKIEAGLIYARYYTASELNQLAEIYEEPVMQKSLSVGPKLQTELMSMGMQNMRKHQPGMDQRMKDVIDQYLSDLLAEENS